MVKKCDISTFESIYLTKNGTWTSLTVFFKMIMVMEFKGTKGKWKVRHLNKTSTLHSTNEVQFGEDGECVAEYVENDYDAKLISKAPELLKLLINLNKEIDAFWNGNRSEEQINKINKVQSNSLKLIKQATKLS